MLALAFVDGACEIRTKQRTPPGQRRLPVPRGNARQYLTLWRILGRMNTVLRRVGGVLLAVGMIDLGVTIVRRAVAGPYLAALDAIAILAGLCLLWGGPRAALWVRSLAVFLLAAGVVPIIATPFYQPLSLTIAELRADWADLAGKAAQLAVLLAFLLWVALELGRASVQEAIIRAGIRRWSMQIPAQAGGGIVLLVGFLSWLSIHGQSAPLAESLALQQLGPDYRYHLSWISSAKTDRGTSVSGVVTAWNDKEVKTVLLHWETR
jgi:hypothetical protein